MIIGDLTYNTLISYISDFLKTNCKNIYKPEANISINVPNRAEGSYVINPQTGNNNTTTVTLGSGLYEVGLIGGGGNYKGTEYWGGYFLFYGGSGGSGAATKGYMYLYDDGQFNVTLGGATKPSYIDYVKGSGSTQRIITAGNGGNGVSHWFLSGGGAGSGGSATTVNTDTIITEDIEKYNGNQGVNNNTSPGGSTLGPTVFGLGTSYLWGEGSVVTTSGATQAGGGYLKFIKAGRHKLPIPDYMRYGNSYVFNVEQENNPKKTLQIMAICNNTVDETTEAVIQSELTTYFNNIGIENLNDKINAGTFFEFVYDLLVFCNNHLVFLTSQFSKDVYLVYKPNAIFDSINVPEDAVHTIIEAEDVNIFFKNLFEYMKSNVRIFTCTYDYYLKQLIEETEGSWTGYLDSGVYKFAICGAIGTTGVGWIRVGGNDAWTALTTYSGGGGFAELSVYLPERTKVEIKSWPKQTGNQAYLKINDITYATASQGNNGGNGLYAGNGSGGDTWIIDSATARNNGYPLKGTTVQKTGVTGGGSSVSSYGGWGCSSNPSGGIRIEFVRKSEYAYPIDLAQY